MSNYTFSVKNLGVLKKGTFEHKPLTLFCGPNNMGKTWTMYALYCSYTLNKPGRLYRRDPRILDSDFMNTLADKDFSTVDLLSLVKENEKDIITMINTIINDSLPYFFNCPEDILKNAKFQLDSVNTEAVKKNLSDDKANRFLKNNILQNKDKEDKKKALIFFFTSFLLFDDTFMIPAERSGLNLLYKELRSSRTALLHHASRDKINIGELLRDVMRSKYAQPIADYIDWLNKIDFYQEDKKGVFHSYAEKLKKDIVGGVYRVSKSGVISFKPYKNRQGPESKSMGLHMTSSMVKCLFGLWFYLEYQAEKGDIVMIDEPELNLHPKNQIKLARILAQLVNAGLKIVVSTHSDYIVREINTLIMLKYVQDNYKKNINEIQEQYGYESDQAIDHTKVGAYLFDNQEIMPFDIKPDDGIYATTFDEVIKKQNERNNGIYYDLQALKDG